MKRVLAVSLVFCAGFALGVIWLGGPVGVRAGGVGAVASQNGDVNGDGTIDISDAVYTLTFLFNGGPPPVPLKPAVLGLPDSGQNFCYELIEGGRSADSVECSKATCWGQDGAYSSGCADEGRFTDNGDGTVNDNCTGLMWQKNTADIDGDGIENDQVSWCEALAYCEGLTLAGHSDWRLPNVRESQSIINYGNGGDGAFYENV